MNTLRNAGLRVPRHRATTAHLCAAYPFHAEAGLGGRGVFLGANRLAGDDAFCIDPFDLYTRQLLTNVNMVVLGEPGCGKSAAVKTLLYRMVGALRSANGKPRWAAICDPKGEYGPLAGALGLDVVRLHPGGAARLNPLDAGPGGGGDKVHLAMRRTTLVTALVTGVLRRSLTAIEDAAVGWAVEAVTHDPAPTQPTQADIANLLANPTAAMTERSGTSDAELARSVDAARFALGKLLDRDLRGMFDGRSTRKIDWSGRGVLLDLSAVHSDPDALSLVMIAATAWLQAVLAPTGHGDDGIRRVQVIDEAWALLANERTARYLQACWKLCRSYGVANIAVAHRISDLRAQADDGTTTAKLGAGLLADTQTRVLFRQSTDQVAQATEMLGLTPAEADLLPRLAKGHALWKVAGISAVVAHVIGPDEVQLVDTDARLVV